MAFVYTLTLPTDRKAARQFRAVFSPIMDRVHIPPDVRDGFLLAMSELITNLDIHPDPRPENVRVTLRRSRVHWQLEIADDGPPFAEMQATAAQFSASEGILRESGMGMQLVADRFPDFTYMPGEPAMNDWNTLTLSADVPSPSGHRPTIMVVDDDPAFLKVMEGYLADAYSVVAFDAAETALEHMASAPVDLIISDIHMPRTDGYELRREANRLPQCVDVPFILLTGSDSMKDRDAAAELSIDDYLNKPVKKLELLATIKRVLKRSADVRSQLGDRLDDEITRVLEPEFVHHPKGYSVAIVHEAASAGGGDVLIEKPVPGGHLIVLADIMGHGEQAKFFAHALSGYVYGAVQGLAQQVTPGSLLEALSNLFLTDRLLRQSMATAVVLLAKSNGELAIASAGHPPPLALRSGQVDEIAVHGPLLGLMESPEYPETHVRIRPGEAVVLFTDGITEAGRSVVEEPVRLFSPSVGNLLDMSDAQIVADMLAGAQVRGDYALQDDATAIVLRRSHD